MSSHPTRGNPGQKRRLTIDPGFAAVVAAIIVAAGTLVGVLIGRVTSNTAAPSPVRTVTVTAPANEQSGSPGDNSTPTSTVFPPASPSPVAGKLIASYDNFKLSQYYYITFAADGRPQPQKSGGDLFLYSTGEGGNFEVYNGTGALLSGAPPSFANCKADTAFGGTVSPMPQGDTICFQGHGVVAAAYLVNYASSGGIDYATLDVRVWQDSSQSQGT